MRMKMKFVVWLSLSTTSGNGVGVLNTEVGYELTGVAYLNYVLNFIRVIAQILKMSYYSILKVKHNI